jgi:hypothetical protein
MLIKVGMEMVNQATAKEGNPKHMYRNSFRG